MLVSVSQVVLKLAMSCALLVFCTLARGQTDEESYGIAILDLKRVLQENEQLQTQLSEIKKKQSELEGKAVEEVLDNAEEVSDVTELRIELLRREANAIFDAYKRVNSVVADLATQHDLRLVLRADLSVAPEEKVRDDLEAVTSLVNRNVVFHRRLDLTNLVIDQIGNANAKHAKLCEKCGQSLSASSNH